MLLGSGAGVHEQIGKKYYVTGHQMLSVNLKKNPNKERIQTVLLQ